MLVYKFGGTSVGNVSRMKTVLDIILAGKEVKIVVLSAMAGTTNELNLISKQIKNGQRDKAQDISSKLCKTYYRIVEELLEEGDKISKLKERIEDTFEMIFSLIKIPYTIANERIILAQGEILSCQLFHALCQERQVGSKLIDALEFMKLDNHGEPDYNFIYNSANEILADIKDTDIVITQGYICKNERGEIDNLKRGGSDYTATILGSLIRAQEIQIWTDIDGMHTNDPRIVEKTYPIEFLSYREAAELSYFGAKILHPTCVLPAEKANVPIRLKSTLLPNASGTLISNKISERNITAIAAKDGITAIKIYSHRMLMAYGFLRKVFEVFENFETSVDMITTSEVAVSLTIDEIHKLEEILIELKILGEVEVEHNHSIICIVGNALYNDQSYIKEIFESVGDIPIRMVSMGGSKYNISILVNSEHKNEVLIRLNGLFG